jgi:hypothetical protein
VCLVMVVTVHSSVWRCVAGPWWAGIKPHNAKVFSQAQQQSTEQYSTAASSMGEHNTAQRNCIASEAHGSVAQPRPAPDPGPCAHEAHDRQAQLDASSHCRPTRSIQRQAQYCDVAADGDGAQVSAHQAEREEREEGRECGNGVRKVGEWIWKGAGAQKYILGHARQQRTQRAETAAQPGACACAPFLKGAHTHTRTLTTTPQRSSR